MLHMITGITLQNRTFAAQARRFVGGKWWSDRNGILMLKANKFLVLFSRRIYRRFISSQSIPVVTSPIPTRENIARLILDQKSAIEALQTFRWASNLPNFTHSQSTYRALIHKLCLFRRFDIVHQLLDKMRSSTCLPPDEGIFITIVRGLGRARRIREVIKVLDLVSKFDLEPSLKLMNSILDVLVKEDIDIAREFYRKKMMGCGVEGDDYTYGILMKGLCATNRIGDGFKLLQVLKTRGIKPNAVIYNTLIHALCENGKVGRARSLMREIAEPSDVTFNVLISAYCKEDNSVQAMVMLEKSFGKGFIPDVITVTKVVGILCKKGRLPEAVEVLERVEERGGKIDVVAYNTLINGFCRLGKVKGGHRLLKEMEIKGYLPNADTYNALISGLCECGMLEMALDMFNEMQRAGIKWNFETFDTLIRGLSSVGRVQDGFKILALMEDSKESCRGHISPYNGIIYGLYRENCLEEAFEFLKKMESLFPRAVDRSLRILSFCEDGNMEEAKNIYVQMINEGGIPSAMVYAALIHTFCQKEQIREALELMNEMISHGYSPIASTLNALIRGLCRQGKIQNASKLLEDMVGRGRGGCFPGPQSANQEPTKRPVRVKGCFPGPQSVNHELTELPVRAGGCFPDIESYSPFIEGFCSKGEFHRAFIIFLQMVERGIVPNFSLWNSLVLCLCQENGLLKDQNKLRIGNQLQSIIET